MEKRPKWVDFLTKPVYNSIRVYGMKGGNWMSDDVNVQIKSTVLEGLGKRKAMFMPMVCVSSFMLVGYAALDTEAPEILTDTLELELNQEIDPSIIKAVDNQDDRSAITITVDQTAYDKTKEGTYVVTVSASDSFNNTSSKEITVINKDKKKPVITLNEAGEGYSSDSNILKVRYGSDGDIRNYITATDDNINSGDNGDLTAFINQENKLDTSKLGTQFISVNVEDDAGNMARQSIPVYIIDDVAPELTLKDDGDAKINYGSTFDLSEFAKAIDEYEGNLTDKITVEGSAPDTHIMGATSTLKLTVEDSSGNKTEKELKLTVADTEAPRISFSKNNFHVAMSDQPLNVADYVTVTDNFDTDINSRVSYSASIIDISTEGEKSVTITAIDKAGNKSTKKFNVTVYDPDTYVGNMVASLVRSKVGCPYVYGATGPNAFDCSGLVQWAYAQAGRSVPRTVHTQYNAVNEYIYSVNALQPGDLIFFNVYGEYLSHVGIYVGDGMMVHAGTEETGVQLTSLYNGSWMSWFECGGRFY